MPKSIMTRVELEAAYEQAMRFICDLETEIRNAEARHEGEALYKSGYLLRALEKARKDRQNAIREARSRLGVVSSKERKARCYSAFL